MIRLHSRIIHRDRPISVLRPLAALILNQSSLDRDTGNTLPFKPRRQSRLDIQWRITPAWTAGVNTQLVSQQYSRADHQAPVSGYAVTSLQTDYTRGLNRFLLRVDNLFDRDYKYGDGFPAPPRIWYAAWTREF